MTKTIRPIVTLCIAAAAGCATSHDGRFDTERGADIGSASQTSTFSERPPVVTPWLQAAGRIDATSDVTPAGNFSYSIPIPVPPGRRGMEPTLGLEYVSNTLNGPVGLGWQISGLSSVYRCEKTRLLDGTTDGVNFDDEDRFCLDGEPLIEVECGDGCAPPEDFSSLIASGTIRREFRLRENDHTKIYAIGSGSGIESWATLTPNGAWRNYERKNTRLLHPDLTDEVTLSWHLSSETDRFANQILYQYDSRPNENPRIAKINYTSNLNLPQYAANRAVTFHYEERDDTAPTFFRGTETTSPWRLKHIKIQAPEIAGEALQYVRYWRLNYKYSSRSGNSLLTDIAVCDFADRQTGEVGDDACLSPTTFSYHEPDTEPVAGSLENSLQEFYIRRAGDPFEPGFDLTINDDTRYFARVKAYLSDVNRDGLNDIIVAKYQKPISWFQAVYRIVCVGFVGCGLVEVGEVQTGLPGSPDFELKILQAGQTSQALLWSSFDGPPKAAITAFGDVIDLDTDGTLDAALFPWSLDTQVTGVLPEYMPGEADIVELGGGNNSLPFSAYATIGALPSLPSSARCLPIEYTGSSLAQDLPANFPFFLWPCTRVYADLNGDGLTDVARPGEAHASSPTPLSWITALGLAPSARTPNTSGQPVVWSDHVYSSGGPHFTDQVSHFQGAIAQDLDGDGRDEVVELNGEFIDALHTWDADETGRLQTKVYSEANVSEQTVFLDVNGDGLADLLHLRVYYDQSRDLGDQNVTDISLQLNTGRSFLAPTSVPELEAYLRDRGPVLALRVADFNGDSRADLLILNTRQDEEDLLPQYERFTLWLSELGTGSGRTFVQTNNVLPVLTGGHDFFFARQPIISNYSYDPNFHYVSAFDATNDGLPDIVGFDGGVMVSLSEDHTGAQSIRDYQFAYDLMDSVLDGRGLQTNVTYDTYAPYGRDPAVTINSDPNLPGDYLRHMRSGGPVVREVQYRETFGRNPGNYDRFLDYRYANGMLDLEGPGFLGFERVTVTDRERRIVTETTYDLGRVGRHYPLKSRPKVVQVSHGEQDPPNYEPPMVKTTTYEYDVIDEGLSYRVRTTREVTSVAVPRPDGSGVDEETTIVSFRLFTSYDTARQVLTDLDDGGLYVTDYTLLPNDEAQWHIDQVNQQTSFFRPSGSSTFTHLSETGLIYDVQRRAPEGVIREPNSSDATLWLSTHLPANSVGLPSRIERRDLAGTVRETTLGYDADGTFLESQTNTLGHTSFVQHHPWTGEVARTEDVLGNTTEYEHDVIGRLRRSRTPDGLEVGYNYYLTDRYNAHPQGRGIYFAVRKTDNTRGIAVDADDNPTATWSAYDAYDRPRFLDTPTVDGRVSRTTFYHTNARGLLTDLYGPTFDLDTVDFNTGPWIAFRYDNFERLTRKSNSEGYVTYEYPNLREHCRIDQVGRQRTTFLNRRGQIQRVSNLKDDGSIVSTTYGFDPAGRVRSVTDISENRVLVERDDIGRVVRLTDPNRGMVDTVYNAFDDVTQTSNALVTTDYTFDALGRIDFSVSTDGQRDYTYDTGPNATGRLVSTLSPDGVGEEYHYDSLGRVNQRSQTSNGIALAVAFGYDGYGRLNRIEYPTSFGAPPAGGGTPPSFQPIVQYNYGADGSIQSISEINELGREFKDVSTSYASGTPREEQRGPLTLAHSIHSQTLRYAGVRVEEPSGTVVEHLKLFHNADGRVFKRQRMNIVEGFTYDDLGRIESWQVDEVSGGGSSVITNNLLQRNYRYDAVERLQSVIDTIAGQSATRTYHYESSLPHAPISFDSENYEYDSIGRQNIEEQLTWSGAAPDAVQFVGPPSVGVDRRRSLQSAIHRGWESRAEERRRIGNAVFQQVPGRFWFGHTRGKVGLFDKGQRRPSRSTLLPPRDGPGRNKLRGHRRLGHTDDCRR